MTDWLTDWCGVNCKIEARISRNPIQLVEIDFVNIGKKYTTHTSTDTLTDKSNKTFGISQRKKSEKNRKFSNFHAAGQYTPPNDVCIESVYLIKCHKACIDHRKSHASKPVDVRIARRRRSGERERILKPITNNSNSNNAIKPEYNWQWPCPLLIWRSVRVSECECVSLVAHCLLHSKHRCHSQQIKTILYHVYVLYEKKRITRFHDLRKFQVIQNSRAKENRETEQ